jgi:hypothetical protein
MITLFIDEEIAEWAVKLLVYYRNHLVNMSEIDRIKLTSSCNQNEDGKTTKR